METEELKKIRFSMLMEILKETSAISGNGHFNKWFSIIQNHSNNNDRHFDELYFEVDDFVKSNYDLIHLFITLKNQCQGIKEPLKVYCTNC